MPKDHRKSHEDFPLAEAQRLREQGLSYYQVADAIGWSMAQTRRYLLREIQPNGDRPETPPIETTDFTPPISETPTTSLQRVEILGEPVSTESSAAIRSDAQAYAALRSRVDALEAHQMEVDAWIATLQAQSRDTAQTHADLRSADPRSLAQHSAEPIWDDPEDAKAVPFNCSLPRGLKRLLDAKAKRTGLPASRLVQRLLAADLLGEGVHDA
jgi:hypothetical protein